VRRLEVNTCLDGKCIWKEINRYTLNMSTYEVVPPILPTADPSKLVDTSTSAAQYSQYINIFATGFAFDDTKKLYFFNASVAEGGKEIEYAGRDVAQGKSGMYEIFAPVNSILIIKFGPVNAQSTAAATAATAAASTTSSKAPAMPTAATATTATSASASASASALKVLGRYYISSQSSEKLILLTPLHEFVRPGPHTTCIRISYYLHTNLIRISYKYKIFLIRIPYKSDSNVMRRAPRWSSELCVTR